MSKVIATGRFGKERHTFEARIINGVLRVECKTRKLNSDEQKVLMETMIDCIMRAPPIAETYCPPVNTLNAAYSGFHNRFFDEDDYEVKVEGKLEPIPYEEDGINDGEEVYY